MTQPDELQQLKAEIKNLRNEIRTPKPISHQSSRCDMSFDITTWIVLSFFMTLAIRWVFPLNDLLTFGQTFVGTGLSLWFVWLAYKLYCWSSTSIKKRPYSDWKVRPRSFVDYVSIILLFLVVILAFALFGPSDDQIVQYKTGFWEFLSEYSPQGAALGFLKGSGKDESTLGDPSPDTGPTDGTLTADELATQAAVTEHSDLLESCQLAGFRSKECNDLPQASAFWKKASSILKSEVSYEISRLRKCWDCGNITTGEGRYPITCNPFITTMHGRHPISKLVITATQCFVQPGSTF